MHAVRTRILIVEDDAACRAKLSAAIQLAPSFNVVASCRCARHAISTIKCERIDVALVDLGLPDGSGIEVIKAIHDGQPKCDVMVVSIFDDEELVLGAIEAGATGYLLKDSEPFEIIDCIHALRAGGAPISPMIARLLLGRIRLAQAAPETDAAPARWALNLSEREREVLRIVSKGMTLAEIAALLEISVNTVKTHVKRIYQKLAVSSRTEAIFEAHRMGLLGSALGLDRECGSRRADSTVHNKS